MTTTEFEHPRITQLLKITKISHDPCRKIIGFLALAAFIGNPLAVRAESIERELYRQAPDMIKTLKDKGYKNVGVLRFLVQKGDEKPTTLAGTLNLDMANRVAIALILQNNG